MASSFKINPKVIFQSHVKDQVLFVTYIWEDFSEKEVMQEYLLLLGL